MSGFLSGRTSLTTVQTADIAANAIDGTLTKDALVGDYSDVTITAADLLLYGDATDSNNTKRDTVQGVLDLVSGGSHVFISTVEASGSATIDITFTPGDADTFVIYLEGILPASDTPEFHMRTAPDGSTFDTSGYSWGNIQQNGTSNSSKNSGSDSAIRAGTDPMTFGNDATGSLNGHVYIHNPSDTAFWSSISYSFMSQLDGAEAGKMEGWGRQETAEAIQGIRFMYSSGNIASGRFSLHKITHS